MIGNWLRAIARALLPVEVRRWGAEQERRWGLYWPPNGRVPFGGLRRVTPIGRTVGTRGLPIDRYYIERFLAAHALDIQGHVLEFGESVYTQKFGGNRVTRSDVLHVVEGNPRATIVADLTAADRLPSDTFDCIVCTQTLQMIFDVRAAVHHLSRILKPRGVLLLTAHGISKIARREGVDSWGEYWHFTSQSLRRLLVERFTDEGVRVQPSGNVLVALAFLHGLAADELQRAELDYVDPDFEVLITARAVKPAAAPGC